MNHGNKLDFILTPEDFKQGSNLARSALWKYLSGCGEGIEEEG